MGSGCVCVCVLCKSVCVVFLGSDGLNCGTHTPVVFVAVVAHAPWLTFNGGASGPFLSETLFKKQGRRNLSVEFIIAITS